ncbi:MAG: PAQR family membrane homeostasis protein TrhA [Bacteroidota bacterium]
MSTGTRSSAPAALARPLSRSEVVADAWVHALGIGGSLVGFPFLVVLAVRQNSMSSTLSLILYGGALIATMSCSALYNGRQRSPRKDLYRRIDHAAIFVMIAATYTPFLAVKIGGAWGLGLLAYVWLVAGAGALVKLLSLGRLERFSVILYLFLGWTIVAAPGPLFSSVSLPAIILLVAGGVLYSVGVLFYLCDRLVYSQAIWHCFVVAAAACHYCAVLGDVALPGVFA